MGPHGSVYMGPHGGVYMGPYQWYMQDMVHTIHTKYLKNT
jgi:hypothetical protein